MYKENRYETRSYSFPGTHGRNAVPFGRLRDRVAEERLVMRYNRLVRMCARPYFLAGGDSEDLIQEGMVGLLAAIRV